MTDSGQTTQTDSNGTDVGLTEAALLNRMTNRIRQSLELQEILAATVAEVRSFLSTDRVKIYRFQPDGSGQVIAESVQSERLPSLLNLFFPATDIPPHVRELFITARQRVIVDVPAQTTLLSRLDPSLTIEPVDTGDRSLAEMVNLAAGDMFQRPVDPCHVEYLKAMGVQSSLVIPILHQRDLWGLLVSHNATPRHFSQQKIQIVQLLADQVSIAIAQSQLLTTTRERAQREAVINQISQLLHAPLPIQTVLSNVLEQIVRVVEGASGRLYLYANDVTALAQVYSIGDQPLQVTDDPPLEQMTFWQHLLAQTHSEGHSLDELKDDLRWQLQEADNWYIPALKHYMDCNLVPIADIYQEPLLEDVYERFRPTAIRSLLVMPLQYGEVTLAFLTIFRNEIDTDIVWAGRVDADDRHQRVRQSFAAWRETKRGQVRGWRSAELEMVRSLGTHLAMAIMQNRLYEYEREQRLLVEMRNQELHTARTVAEEASRLKSDFLSSTSHELRTPLASTLNYLRLLKEKFYDNEEELQQYIDVAYHSAETLVALINDVLDIAKIEAGRMQVHWEIVNLPDMLNENADLFRLDSRQKEIPLVINCQVGEIWADHLKLKQILTNLLANAFKFTNAGTVTIRAIQKRMTSPLMPPVLEISVSDTGIGVDSDRRDTLFEPFVQADGSIKRRYGGTGLGLTICKRLVELMGGQIWLDSAGNQQGTIVTFTIPQQRPT